MTSHMPAMSPNIRSNLYDPESLQANLRDYKYAFCECWHCHDLKNLCKLMMGVNL